MRARMISFRFKPGTATDVADEVADLLAVANSDEERGSQRMYGLLDRSTSSVILISMSGTLEELESEARDGSTTIMLQELAPYLAGPLIQNSYMVVEPRPELSISTNDLFHRPVRGERSG